MLPSKAPVSVIANAETFPPPDPGYYRFWLYFFGSRSAMVDSVSKENPGSRIRWAREGFKPQDFDDPWEPGAFTNDIDSAIVADRVPLIRDLPVVGTYKVVHHEFGGHCMKHGDQWTDGGEHHKPPWSNQPDGLRCPDNGLCAAAGHALRVTNNHAGGFTIREALALTVAARRAGQHWEGYRLAYLDVDAARVPHAPRL